MKKTLFSIVFLTATLFCLPVPALGAIVQLTVTISSIQIPERAAMLYKSVNKEFAFDGGARVVVVKKSDGTLGTPIAAEEIYHSTYGRGVLRQGSSAKIAFNYDPTLVPFNVYIEIVAMTTGGDIYCSAGCIPVSNSYRSATSLYMIEGGDVSCPAPACDSPNSVNIAFPSGNIFSQKGSNEYWRSP